MRIITLFIFSLVSFFITAQDFSTYEWKVYNMENTPFSSNHVREIIFDEKNDLTWVTTNVLGLFSFDGTEWKEFPTPKEWKQTWWLNDIYFDNKGVFWIAGYVGYILKFDTRTLSWDRIPFPEGQPWIIRPNGRGTLLISTSVAVGKLYQYRNGKFSLLDDRYQDGFDILFRKNGNALVSFRKGVYEYTMNSDGSYAQEKSERVFKHAIYEMAFDSKYNLWAASYSSKYLHVLKNGKWETIKDAPEKIFFDYNGKWQYIIHNVLNLPDDRIIISTQFNGSIAIYNGENWEAYNLPLETKTDGIERIKMDKNKWLWCSTWNNGLFIFKPKEKEEIPDTLPQWIAPIKDGENIYFADGISRKAETISKLTYKKKKIRIEIKDSKKVDGDIASIYFNGKTVLKKEKISAVPFSFDLELQKGENEILLFAHNLGKIPPNTISLKIFQGKDEKEIVVDSDFENCGRVIIEYK